METIMKYFIYSGFLLLGLTVLGCVTTTQVIGHRGASFYAPENTLASINLAWEQNADGVEIDIHLTKDNRVVAIHDATTTRTSGVNLKIKETVSDELRNLDFGKFKSEKFAGEKIPFLEEVIATIPPTKILFVEIKCGKEVLPYFKQIVIDSGKISQIVVIGFELSVVSACKSLIPEVPVYWLVTRSKNPSTNRYNPYNIDNLVRVALKNKLNGLDANCDGLNKKFVQKAKSANLKVYAWTVNDPYEAMRLKKIGVDGITTDKPDLMLKTLH